MIDKSQWRESGQDTGVTPLLFTSAMGFFFNDHRDLGPQFNVSSERRLIQSNLEQLLLCAKDLFIQRLITECLSDEIFPCTVGDTDV